MSGKGKVTHMTPKAASRIQSSQAKQNDGKVDKGSFAAELSMLLILMLLKAMYLLVGNNKPFDRQLTN